ncbi:hypothetical protein B0H16DRAFT_1470631 [Mycena metata]|uniref:Uncharacterized protein n=1 Tax=Mycena metata TaxID=1033252 RepID=A0AAD7MQV1_9AGAR|nr:hypothetical protein B0H16DRAFT_1470631 [Mycena metata]
MHQLQILLLFSLSCFAGSGLNTQQISTLPLCGVLETVGRKLDCFLPTSMGPISVPGPSRNICLKSAGLICDSAACGYVDYGNTSKQLACHDCYRARWVPAAYDNVLVPKNVAVCAVFLRAKASIKLQPRKAVTSRAATRCRDGHGRRSTARWLIFLSSDGTAIWLKMIYYSAIKHLDSDQDLNLPEGQRECTKQFFSFLAKLLWHTRVPSICRSGPSFNGPFLRARDRRRNGHGTRLTGAVEPSQRQRAAAIVTSGCRLSSLLKRSCRSATPIGLESAATELYYAPLVVWSSGSPNPANRVDNGIEILSECSSQIMPFRGNSNWVRVDHCGIVLGSFGDLSHGNLNPVVNRVDYELGLGSSGVLSLGHPNRVRTPLEFGLAATLTQLFAETTDLNLEEALSPRRPSLDHGFKAITLH